MPLIIGLANKLHLAEVLNPHLGTHRLQRGVHNGQLAVGWLADMLSQADHRQSAVRDGANGLPHTWEPLLGHPIREVEFRDDRLGGVLYRLSHDETWEAIAHDVWRATVTGYERELPGIRLESTTSSGYHHGSEEGVRQRGPSKDPRPALPHRQLRAAAAAPSGHLLAGDVPPGPCADDPLSTPLGQRGRDMVGRAGLLSAGDGKMAALATRAELAAPHDLSLLPLPLPGETATPVETWGTAIVDGAHEATLLGDGAHWLGAGSAWERPLQAMVDGQPIGGTARVPVGRSPTLAQRQQATLDTRLAAAAEALWALTPAPGRGKRQLRDAVALQAAIARVLERHKVAGLLTAPWARHETTVTGDGGRGRGGADRPPRTQTQVRYALTGVQRQEDAMAARRHRLGWRVQVTTAPVDRRPLSQAVRHDRGGWTLERDCHLVNDLPLGLQPVLVWKEEQIKGLTRLLTLALRLLTLRETQGRRGLLQAPLAGLSEGLPTRTTARPTGTRILQAFARAQCTLTRVERGRSLSWHLTPLAPRHEQLLRHLHLPTSLYTALADNAS